MSMSSDTKAIIGIGIGLATLLLMLIGMMFQQNANVNARIDDVQSTIRDLRADVQADMNVLHGGLQELRADVREIRGLLVDHLDEHPTDSDWRPRAGETGPITRRRPACRPTSDPGTPPTAAA